MLKGKKQILCQILFLIDTFLVAYVKAHWHFFKALYVFGRGINLGPTKMWTYVKHLLLVDISSLLQMDLAYLQYFFNWRCHFVLNIQ